MGAALLSSLSAISFADCLSLAGIKGRDFGLLLSGLLVVTMGVSTAGEELRVDTGAGAGVAGEEVAFVRFMVDSSLSNFVI